LSNVISVGDANIHVEKFVAYQREAMQHLTDEAELKEKAKTSASYFKDTVEVVAKDTGLAKPEVAAYFKARFAEKQAEAEEGDEPVGTQVVINRGNLYELLNQATEV
jgi:outer membrane translocation and assembly module TamA